MTKKKTAASDGATLGRGVADRFENRVLMVVPGRHNAKLRRLIERVNADDEIYARSAPRQTSRPSIGSG